MDVPSLGARKTDTPSATLGHKYVGDITGLFFIPGYQRGYRWDITDVKRLLDDIWHALDNSDQKQPYNLQPIVVKLRQQGLTAESCHWELVDGQQRLTTLTLIFIALYRHATTAGKEQQAQRMALLHGRRSARTAPFPACFRRS